MPAVLRTPRERWIDAGLEALAERGPDAVRIEVLATRLGVTKGGFYGHFSGREPLLAALLDEWERRCTDEVIERAEAATDDPVDRLRQAGRLSSSAELRRIDLAVRIWARRDPAVAERLRRVDARRREYVRELFRAFLDDPDEVEARTTLLFALAIGRYFMVDEGADGSAAIARAGEHLLRP